MKSSLIRCCYRQSGRAAYRPVPNRRIPFNGRIPRDPCSYMDRSLLIYRSRRDGRL